MMNDYNKYSDEKLLILLEEPNPLCGQAFDVIYNRYSSRLNAYCLFKSISKMDAEEVFEDAWLKFLDSIKKGKKLSAILPYLYAIARNIVIDKHRRNKAKKSIAVEYRDVRELDAFVGCDGFLSQLENDELISLVKIAVGNIDEIYKDAFVLHWFGGMTHKEIAEILDINASSVKMRCHRAMKMIIKILRPYFIEVSR